MTFVRQGSCLGCGRLCCTRVGVPMSDAMLRAYGRNEPVRAEPTGDADIDHWLELHGLAPDFPIPADAEIRPFSDGRWMAMFPKRCTALREDETCGLYGSPSRPRVCEEWPAFPGDLEALTDEGRAACGYRFVEA